MVIKTFGELLDKNLLSIVVQVPAVSPTIEYEDNKIAPTIVLLLGNYLKPEKVGLFEINDLFLSYHYWMLKSLPADYKIYPNDKYHLDECITCVDINNKYSLDYSVLVCTDDISFESDLNIAHIHRSSMKNPDNVDINYALKIKTEHEIIALGFLRYRGVHRNHDTFYVHGERNLEEEDIMVKPAIVGP